jgi:thiol-disulfide isomerase/thioredoxin
MQRMVLLALVISAVAALCAAQEPPSPPSGIPLREETSPEVSAILNHVFSLRDQGKTENALKILDDALLKHKDKTYDRYALLSVKFELLSNLSKYQEALEAAIEKGNIVTSPRQALNVAQVFLKMGDLEHALEWLEASVNRGLQSYAILEDDTYRPLRDNPRFRSLAETVKKRNGLGLPAKPFQGKTILRQEVSLDEYKGKVLLLDFWATWCGPCLAEMPNLKRCYDEFKDKGFEIVGFAENENDDALQGYLRKNSITWPIVSKNNDHYEAVVLSYAVKNIPASFLIDRTGILRHVNLTGDSLRNAIDQLIKE